MDIFDDFDSEGKGYLKHAQIQHAYKEIFNESRKNRSFYIILFILDTNL